MFEKHVQSVVFSNSVFVLSINLFKGQDFLYLIRVKNNAVVLFLFTGISVLRINSVLTIYFDKQNVGLRVLTKSAHLHTQLYMGSVLVTMKISFNLIIGLEFSTPLSMRTTHFLVRID